MSHLLIHHQVEDYNKWKPFFDDNAGDRAEHGSMGGSVFRSVDNPNDLFILLEIKSVENAKKFTQSDSLKEAMKKAGVISLPEVYFLEEAAETTK